MQLYTENGDYSGSFEEENDEESGVTPEKIELKNNLKEKSESESELESRRYSDDDNTIPKPKLMSFSGEVSLASHHYLVIIILNNYIYRLMAMYKVFIFYSYAIILTDG